MARKTFNLPDPGEGLVEAEITEWKVAPGDTVTVNQILVEVETAKSLVELPSPWAGTVVEVLVEVGRTVDVGTALIVIDDGLGGDEPAAAAPAASATARASAGSAPAASAKPEPTLVGYGAKEAATTRRARKTRHTGGRPSEPPVRSIVQESFDPEQMSVDPEHPGRQAMWRRADQAEASDPMRALAAPPAGHGQPGRTRAKPPVRKYARDLGIDLSRVTPTGPDGTVTRQDVDAHRQAQGGAAGAAALAAAGQPDGPVGAGTSAALAYAPGERETRIPIKGVRKMMAQAMVGSAFTAPHVTEWVTVDMTRTMELVERLKNDREFRQVRVTPLLVLAKAMCLAVRRHPEVNSSWDEAAQEIVLKHYVNLGIAAATTRGLIVPNIKDADAMSMVQLADAIGTLVATAREGRTQPADMSGGTITITNVGVFGVDLGTPIINPGEAAIMAFGAIRRMPWVVSDSAGGERVEPRWVGQLALSFDHRIIDGELGSRYLADVAAIMNDPARALVWG